LGISRAASSEYIKRGSGTNETVSVASLLPIDGNYFVLARNNFPLSVGNFSNARLAFYSIGESLDLALLDARVTDLINAFAAAIP
jgi:hypothetical protein